MNLGVVDTWIVKELRKAEEKQTKQMVMSLTIDCRHHLMKANFSRIEPTNMKQATPVQGRKKNPAGNNEVTSLNTIIQCDVPRCIHVKGT